MDVSGSALDGLVNYVEAVVGRLGGDVEGAEVDVDGGFATAIIAVRSRVPTLPGCRVLLTWDEINGWALRVVTSEDDDTVVVSYLGEDILPKPHTVDRYLREAEDGESPGALVPPDFRRPNADDGLERRLVRFGG
ncbi:hypothetical protein HUO13_07355 [Saccharopolyspora erythraea]|uniref:DUF6292 family protein n=1 Tax=Saccharopolyspora erythraea TaxID=1836 RepID=UPI001BAE2062|nr:DUF6292 family protein [Saccharopolyspora erythraea]QUH00652.1 hypothetical protein HUO13_07355 [Saccharopolyspora erythraea]